MESIEQGRDYVYLKHLVESSDGTLKKFAVNKADAKELELTGPAKKAYETSLLARGYVIADGKGANKKFAITASGRERFANLPKYPTIKPPDSKLKALVMLNLLAMGDGRLSLKQVKALLTPAFAKTLSVSKDAVVPLLDALLADRAVEQSSSEGQSPDDRVSYRLTETGKQQTAHLPQHVDATFKLTGRTINQLLEYATGRPPAGDPVIRNPANQTNVEPARLVQPTGTISDDELIREAKSLMPTLGRNGLLPIFELRRHVRKKFGERAGSHEELDPRLKRLRGERLDLISIQEQGHVGRDQTEDGVKGLGELFFYVSNLR